MNFRSRVYKLPWHFSYSAAYFCQFCCPYDLSADVAAAPTFAAAGRLLMACCPHFSIDLSGPLCFDRRGLLWLLRGTRRPGRIEERFYVMGSQASPLPDLFALPTHGGDLLGAEARFGRPPAGWLDLSTGISPFAYPLPTLAPECWQRLPDRDREDRVRRVAAAAYGVSGPDQVVMAAGSQAIIQALPRLRAPSRVAVVGPTYAEHAACWTQGGHQLSLVETLERAGDAEVAIVVNPNNPDGRRHDRRRLQALANDMAGRGGLLIVDEAFGDLDPTLSMAPEVRPGLLVLRSFGKFFGLAGLRLGFALAEPSLARALQSALGPWPVNGPALAVGEIALADHAWIASARGRLHREAGLLDGILTAAGLQVTGGTDLFRLVNAPRAWALYEHLGHNGILVRPFAAAPRWLRVGLPPGEQARARLQQALAAWV